MNMEVNNDEEQTTLLQVISDSDMGTTMAPGLITPHSLEAREQFDSSDALASLVENLRRRLNSDSSQLLELPMFGEWLRLRRGNKGLSLEDIADALGTSITWARVLETGYVFEKDLTELISRIAEALEVDEHKLKMAIERERRLPDQYLEGGDAKMK